MTIPPDIALLISGLPGEEWILKGLRDLDSGEYRSREALLILMACSRLTQAGFRFLKALEVEPHLAGQDVESHLYQSLRAKDPATAYGRYNSMKRRLDSFVCCLERRAEREGVAPLR